MARRIASSQPSILYTQAQETADFGAAQFTLALTIAQMSAVAGRGFERRVVIPIR